MCVEATGRCVEGTRVSVEREGVVAFGSRGVSGPAGMNVEGSRVLVYIKRYIGLI